MKNINKYFEADEVNQANLKYSPCVNLGLEPKEEIQKCTSYFNTAIINNTEKVNKLCETLHTQKTNFKKLDAIKDYVSGGNITFPKTGRGWYVFQINPSVITVRPNANFDGVVSLRQYPLDTKTGTLSKNPISVLDINCPSKTNTPITQENTYTVLTNFIYCAISKVENTDTYQIGACVPLVYSFGVDSKKNIGCIKLTPGSETEYYSSILYKGLYKNETLFKNSFDSILAFLEKTKNIILEVKVNSENNNTQPSNDGKNTGNEKETDTSSKPAVNTDVNPLSKDWSVAQKTMADNFIQSTFKNIASSLTSKGNSKEFEVKASDNNTYIISLENNNAKINFKLIERLTVRNPNLKLQEGSVLFDGARALSNKALANMNDKSLGKDTLKFILELDNVVIQKVVNSEDNKKNLVHVLPNNNTFLRDIATVLVEKFKVGFDKALQDSEFTYGNYSFRVQVNFSEKEIKCTPVDAKKSIYDISIPVEVVKTDIKERTLSKVKSVLTPAAAVAGGILAGVGSLTRGGHSYNKGSYSLN